MTDGRQKIVFRAVSLFPLSSGFRRRPERVPFPSVGEPLFGNVARNVRNSDDVAQVVTNGGDGLGHIDETAILSPPPGFVMLNTFSAADSLQDLGFFVRMLLRNQKRDR